MQNTPWSFLQTHQTSPHNFLQRLRKIIDIFIISTNKMGQFCHSVKTTGLFHNILNTKKNLKTKKKNKEIVIAKQIYLIIGVKKLRKKLLSNNAKIFFIITVKKKLK